jgi:hypothetical protein
VRNGRAGPQGWPGPGSPYPEPAPSGQPWASDPFPVPASDQPHHPPLPQPAEPWQAPVAFRPPSRLAPPMSSSVPSPAVNAVNGAAPVGPGAELEDDPIASTSGRVPWAVAGGSKVAEPPAQVPSWPVGAPLPPAPTQSPISPPSGPGPALPSPSSFPAAAAAALSGTDRRDAPGPVRAPRGLATAVATAAPVLRVDSGEQLTLGPFCLLGREPVAADGDPPAHLIKFEDSKLSVSKTHLAYGLDSQGFWVIDRNSTNGTTMIDPSGRRTPCAPGVRQYVPIGSQLQIGQRRITVEEANAVAAES